MWELQIKLLKMSTPWCVKCLKLAPVCLNDNTTVDPAVSELYTTPVDIPAECVRLIFSLNVISAGRGAESTVNQTGTDPVNSHTHRHTHTHQPGPDKIKATVLRSASPGLMLPLESAIPV